MTVIKNAILSPIQGLVGSPGVGTPTVLDDDSISMTLPILPDIARRSLAIGIGQGWFQGLLENVHGAADDEVSTIDPYNPGDDRIAPYPAVVEPGSDVWILGVSGIRSSGAGGLTGGTMGFSVPDTVQGWGRDDQGVLVAETPRFIFAQFDNISTLSAGLSQPPMQTEQGLIYQPVGVRVPRGGIISFHSTSAAAAEFQAIFLIGLFPSALGQDVAT